MPDKKVEDRRALKPVKAHDLAAALMKAPPNAWVRVSEYTIYESPEGEPLFTLEATAAEVDGVVVPIQCVDLAGDYEDYVSTEHLPTTKV